MTLLDFSLYQILAIALVFAWTGFVRTGLGFGGAALGLPLMLFIHNNPLLWLPIIGVHLLFFSGLTLFNSLHNVDWQYLRYSAIYIIPAALIGVFGLLNLPVLWLNGFIYSVTLFYGFTWLLNRGINSQHVWADRGLLILGGYIAGISLTGAPLMVAVYMRNVSKYKLRDTLFILWFILVSLKMTAFIALSVDLHLLTALTLLPIATIGHILGLKAHNAIMRNDLIFKRWIGGGLVTVSLLGLWQLYSQFVWDVMKSNGLI
ncbi:TSUP family transporter [Methylobacter sp.]|uniref:TSUP family transporter n=1 Tax=Methylobacter sp. TaxID=2051955 RepID=UPI0011FAB97B|nr:TSUP family transporter [Methylobacter sp.]TAK62911.1 MAG: sulfite exporter TauE/SafE family protein [Methylobacter sp.]